jgi:hypothetical protein
MPPITLSLRVPSIMPTETRGKPHPTPHPDQPRKPGPIQEPIPEPLTPEEVDPEGPPYDSDVDDLDVILSQPVANPDPALQSNAPPDEAARAPQARAPVPPSPKEGGKPPKTSEVFKAIGPQTGETAAPASGSDAQAPASASLVRAVPQGAVAEQAEAPGRSGQADPSPPGSQESEAQEDDRLADARVSWFILLLLSYSSAVTLALCWMLWTGRAFLGSEPPATGTSQPGVEHTAKPAESKSSVAPPPIPAENLTSLGKTIRVGELEITPLQIVACPLQLVRSIDPSDVRDEESESLVLQLKLTNVSREHAFAPLEAALVREQSSSMDRPYITTSSGARIHHFPLALDSEWLIAGQSFPVLQPGETMETLLASESIAAGRPTGEMTWRVRLRIGIYRSDMIGVRFTDREMMP